MSDRFGKLEQINAYGIYPYIKKGNETTKADKGIQMVLYALKDGKIFKSGDKSIDPAAFLADRAAKWPEVVEVADGCDLVPVPGSVPRASGAYWPALAFANSLQKAGLGAAVNPCVERATPVAKSSRQKSKGARPTVAMHVASLKVLNVPARPILLIDDALTLGTTSMGVQQALRAAGHLKTISLLAACHTRGQLDEVKRNVKFVVTWYVGADHADKSEVADSTFPG